MGREVVIDMDVHECFCLCARCGSEPSSTCMRDKKGTSRLETCDWSLSLQRVHVGAITLHQRCELVRGIDERSSPPPRAG